MDGLQKQLCSSILNVSSSRDLGGHADVTLRVADIDVTFQVLED